MDSFRLHTGAAAPLEAANVDTDQLIPKQFLKRIERSGFGDVLFYNWRYRPDGTPNPDFMVNQPAFQGATVLLSGPNFGSGSSREHAVWALQNYGFRAVIAPSFADIFFNNCFKNGLLPVVLPDAIIQLMMDRAKAHAGYTVTVDLEQCRVMDGLGLSEPFAVDAFRRRCLLEGLDDISLTMEHEAAITAFEGKRESFLFV